jgi:hypothetical protein
MSRQRIESNRNKLNRNELIFNSSSTNSSNFSGINNNNNNNNNAILKNNEISSSVDLPDETVSYSSGGSSSINFDRYNNNNNKTKRKNNNFNYGIDKLSDSSEKSINTMTVSDLDTRTSQNQSDLKLLRKKFIKFILREDTYSLVMFF